MFNSYKNMEPKNIATLAAAAFVAPLALSNPSVAKEAIDPSMFYNGSASEWVVLHGGNLSDYAHGGHVSTYVTLNASGDHAHVSVLNCLSHLDIGEDTVAVVNVNHSMGGYGYPLGRTGGQYNIVMTCSGDKLERSTGQ